MNSLIGVSLSSIDSLAQLAIEYCVAVSIWLMLVCLVAIVARRQSAAVQHAVWIAGMCGVLVLPATLNWLPKFYVVPRLETPAGMVATGPTPLPVHLFGSPVFNEQSRGTSVPDHNNIIQSSATHVKNPRVSLQAIAILAWAVGSIALALRMIMSTGYLLQLTYRRSRKRNESLQSEANQCAAALSFKRRFVLIPDDQITTPMAFGILVGRVAVPSSIEIQSQPKRQAILLHELGHLRRHDPLWHGIVEAAFALLWFHPLVWLARRQSYLTRERACDDVVLAAGAEPAIYAHCMVRLVAESNEACQTRLLSVAMSTSDRVEDRIRAIMDRSRDRRPLGSFRLGLVSLTVVCVVVLIGCLRLETRTALAQEPAIQTQLTPTDSTDANPLRRVVTGRITDPDGAPIARAKMFFEWYSRKDGRHLRQVEVDDDGSFRLEHMLESPVDDWAHTCVWVYADGYAARAVLFHVVFREPKVNGIEIRLQKPQSTEVEVRLPDDQACPDALVTPASIHTCQLAAVDGNYAIEDSSGVFTDIPKELLQDLGTKSDSLGKATITSFVATSFRAIDVRKRGFGQQSFGIAKDQRIFRLAPTGTIAGRISIDDPKSIAGTIVTIVSNHLHGPYGIAEVVVDEQGKFHVPEIVVNRSPLVIRMSWKETLPLHPYYDRGRRDTVPAGGVLDVVIETKPAVKVTGQILTADTGEPVAGAEAFLNSLLSPLNGVRAITDQRGYFSLLVCPGPSLQQVTSLGSDRSLGDRYDYPRMGQVDIPDDVTELKLEPYLLTLKKIVKGALRDRAGKGLGGRTVVIHDRDFVHVRGKAITDANGSFVMPVREWEFISRDLGENGRFQWSVTPGEQINHGTIDKNYAPLTQVLLDGEAVVLETQ